ncbi:hypothetical protein TNIN_170941 [Trichonephila inaurata madagascariensis]|uniref:Uncharacterized protein n=1 Tax=Trichonephila inaurata madagascariensis TaxID=2747483 RepID=A0A8X7C9B0_9ARAC|nr:hypothetical protein TNIN_170941 [Trichonephila inaurata madagascariensis]
MRAVLIASVRSFLRKNGNLHSFTKPSLSSLSLVVSSLYSRNLFKCWTVRNRRMRQGTHESLFDNERRDSESRLERTDDLEIVIFVNVRNIIFT